MPTREIGGRIVDVDQRCFLVDATQWTPEVAAALAGESGISALTPEHWQVIDYCRSDAEREGKSPGLRRISKFSGIGMKALYSLFPKGPGKLAALIAGLPKPKSCV